MSISKLQMLCAPKIQHIRTLPSSITRQRFSVHLFPEKQFLRLASTEQKNTKVTIPQTKPKDGQVSTVTEKVKQAGKDVTYTGIVIAGLGITGAIFFWIGRELFSGQSPSGVYGKAVKECLNNTEVVSVLGEPVKGYGEMTRRGRRRYVRYGKPSTKFVLYQPACERWESHSEYELEGVKHMRMKFYVEGPFRKGTVHLEVKMNDRGVYEYRYLFVELDGYPSRTIIIQDNR